MSFTSYHPARIMATSLPLTEQPHVHYTRQRAPVPRYHFRRRTDSAHDSDMPLGLKYTNARHARTCGAGFCTSVPLHTRGARVCQRCVCAISPAPLRPVTSACRHAALRDAAVTPTSGRAAAALSGYNWVRVSAASAARRAATQCPDADYQTTARE